MNLPPLPAFPDAGTAEEKSQWFQLARLHADAERTAAIAAGTAATLALVTAQDGQSAALLEHAKAQADTAQAMREMPQFPPHAATLAMYAEQTAAVKGVGDSITAVAAALTAVAERPAPPGSVDQTGVLVEVIRLLASGLSAKA